MSNNSFIPPDMLEEYLDHRMGVISRNGNDGIHYRDRCSGCVTKCKECENEVSEVVDEAIDKGTEAYVTSFFDEYSIEPTLSDGSTASYYELPESASELQDLISYRNMNAQVGEAFRALYRLGEGHHSSRERDIKKVIFYMQAELERIEKYE